MVGARLVEDSSIRASGDWSSESSTFFIRELGPLTKARPETRSREHSDFICSSTPSAHSRTHIFKVGKTTRPFSYDLNQIPYNYTVEVRNRFKGLDRVPEELWTSFIWTMFMTLYRRQRSRPSPRKRNAKGKIVV